MPKNDKDKKEKKRFGLFRFTFGLIGKAVNLAVNAAGLWIAYSRFFIDHNLPLPRAVDAERKTFTGEGTGALSYYADTSGEGRPLVLVHSINAAGCAYEVKPIFEHYRGSRPVYALELPGFGFSERADREYTPALYKEAILQFLTGVVGEPADVQALSLSSEFAALAADESPDAFHTLIMISPSGFNGRGEAVSSKNASDAGVSETVYKVLAFPAWGQALFDLIATKRSIHFFLSRSFEGEIDEGLAEYGYLTSHQPGAQHAPLYFVSGGLFTSSIQRVYERLKVPALVIYDRDGFTGFSKLPDVIGKNPNVYAVRVWPTCGLAHFERQEETFAAMDEFWQTVDAPPVPEEAEPEA